MNTAEITLPKLLVRKALEHDDKIVMREKYKGIWQEISWTQYAERTKHLCLGLKSVGIEKGDRAAILGENCPKWIFSDLAIQCNGGICVGIYPTNSPEQVHYILEHSGSKFIVVTDQEQADKVLSIKDQLPLLAKMIVIDMRGMRHYDDPLIIGYDEVEALGKEIDQREPEAFSRLVEQTDPDDMAFIVYTSGTTGFPKGAMITHRSVLHQAVHCAQPLLRFTPDDEIVSYLPLCHILERNVSMVLALVYGFTVNFAESIDTVQQNIREISPTFFAAVPRILEKLHSSVLIKLEDSTRFKRLVYRAFEPVGRMAAQYDMARNRKPFWLMALYMIGYFCCFRALRDKIGLLSCKRLMSGGAPIAPEILDFFRGLGVNTLEMYGLTETCGTVAGPHHAQKYASVGEPAKGLELKLADDGEILVRGDSVFLGYYRDEDATVETVADGWLLTGDVGEFDEDGHLYIVDRKKDIIITSGGKNISPAEIENKMKCSPHIKEVIVIGDGKKFLSALIQIDYDNVGNWAQNKRIPYTTYQSLARNSEVHALVKGEILQVNDTLANVETIKKFHILDKELDQDDEELTATQKVKRKVIAKRFEKEIEEMYRPAKAR